MVAIDTVLNVARTISVNLRRIGLPLPINRGLRSRAGIQEFYFLGVILQGKTDQDAAVGRQGAQSE